ncbi:cytochrome b/b6 domain-containing protein [Pseudothauera rhizosphaerae]|uniref:Cytochrome B n=1 Tax=Pseudothauera rhizosphaerae TaxID=2565932 RepID=A0A4S4ASA2_9RHOO|nr:cytochrome b/b6 domain-containing protein [Pseudothauera rhizosphaerae]THF62068.1 cytochrome B [Pseudothauera rhizosphaerae]
MNRKRIRVWDLPTRLFHWSLVVVAVAAVLTGVNGGNMMVHHQRLGVILVGLIAFRLTWGVIGSQTARFTRFVRGPGAIAAYLRGQWRGIGHNPVGALSVLALLGLFGFQAVSGLFTNDDIAFEGPLRALVDKATSDWITGVHGSMLWWLAGLVAVHVGAVVFYLHAKKDNLVKPMITGWKEVDDPEADSTRGGTVVAFVIALAVGLAAAWIAAGGLLPPPPPPPEPAAVPAW